MTATLALEFRSRLVTHLHLRYTGHRDSYAGWSRTWGIQGREACAALLAVCEQGKSCGCTVRRVMNVQSESLLRSDAVGHETCRQGTCTGDASVLGVAAHGKAPAPGAKPGGRSANTVQAGQQKWAEGTATKDAACPPCQGILSHRNAGGYLESKPDGLLCSRNALTGIALVELLGWRGCGWPSRTTAMHTEMSAPAITRATSNEFVTPAPIEGQAYSCDEQKTTVGAQLQTPSAPNATLPQDAPNAAWNHASIRTRTHQQLPATHIHPSTPC